TPASECTIPVLYEDSDLLIVHKPSGMPSVSLSGTETGSASAQALAHFPDLAEIEDAKPLEPGLLHRLDTGTSGVLVFAKSAEEFSRLKAVWKTPQTRKVYRAIVERTPSAQVPKPCTIQLSLAHPANSSKRII